MVIQGNAPGPISSSRTCSTAAFASPSASAEPIAHNSTCQVPRQAGAVHGIGREARRVAELVAAGVGKGIREGQDQGNSYVTRR